MSRFGRFEIIEPTPSLFLTETSSSFPPKAPTLNPCFFSIEEGDELDLTLDLLNPNPILFPDDLILTSPFHDFDLNPFYTSTQRLQRRLDKQLRTDLYLQSLSDRVSALELGVDRFLLKPKLSKLDRKYTWTTEIKTPGGGLDRKYKLTTEIKGGKEEEKTYKWAAEIKGKGKDSPISRTYTFEASSGNAGDRSGSKKKEKNVVAKKKKKSCEKAESPARVVEIEEPTAHGIVLLRQAFAKRAADKSKGKRKELSPQDAAMMIQLGFRAYLIQRSQALRALRELAVAKAKLKEIRALFNNFTYRRVSRDAEEKQKFSERIIVLLLTVDAIEGVDLMVRAAKRSMVDELEAMLDVVDPQPQGRSLSVRKRTFDMPDGVIQKEIAAGCSNA